MRRPHCPALPNGLFTREPRIRTAADPLTTLAVKRFSCVTVVPRRSVSVDAITEHGARLVGAHKLGTTPERVVVVEIGRLVTTGAA